MVPPPWRHRVQASSLSNARSRSVTAAICLAAVDSSDRVCYMADRDPRLLDSVRDSVATTLSKASSILQSALREWLAEILARLLTEQPQVVMILEPAALSALKSDLGRACDETLASAESMIKDLDLEKAAPEALGYPTGERLLDFEARVDRLLDGPIGVLARGGFNVGAEDLRKGDLLKSLRTSVAIALVSYGKYVLDLRAVSAEEARAAWDRA